MAWSEVGTVGGSKSGCFAYSVNNSRAISFFANDKYAIFEFMTGTGEYGGNTRISASFSGADIFGAIPDWTMERSSMSLQVSSFSAYVFVLKAGSINMQKNFGLYSNGLSSANAQITVYDKTYRSIDLAENDFVIAKVLFLAV